MASPRIPITLITGFLGSGKTTLICSLLQQIPELKAAILVNEFGDVSVDGQIIRSDKGCRERKVCDLPAGCICCTIQDEFVPTLKRVISEHAPQHIIIEASGLAEPAPVIDSLRWRELSHLVELDAVVAVVDAAQLLAGSYTEGEVAPDVDIPEHMVSIRSVFAEQLEFSDLILLNRAEVLKEHDFEKAEALLSSVESNLGVILPVRDKKLPVSAVLGHGGHDRLAADGHHHHHHDHDHEHNIWQQGVLVCNDPVSKSALEQGLADLAEQGLFRAKGQASLEGSEIGALLQMVGGRCEISYQANTKADGSRLVAIGHRFDLSVAAEHLHKLTGYSWNVA